MQQLVYGAILAAAFGLLMTERLRKDLVAVLIILALYVTGILSAREALSGLSSEPAIVIAAIFVLAAALHKTGLSEMAGGWIGRLAGNGLPRMLAVIMPAVALLSAFTHHVTTTAVMLPVVRTMSREHAVPVSKLLMPLSFAASLGTTITIIGAPAFLVASELLRQAERPGLGIFSIAPVGLSISLAGTAFMLLVGRFLLPAREGREDAISRFRLGQYYTELAILPNSPYLHQTVEEVEEDGRYEFSVVGLVRDGRHLPAPLGQRRLRAGDVLLVNTSPDEIVGFRQDPGVELQPVAQHEGHAHTLDGDMEHIADRLVQAVVAPGSPLAGSTLKDLDFRRRYGALVLSLWRQGDLPAQPLAQVELREGDVLVLQGSEAALGRIATDPDFLMVVPFQGEPRRRRKAFAAGGIMLATVAAAAFNWLTVEMAALAGAAAVVLSGCLSARQAYRAIDHRIFVFIAGAIPLGLAMEKTGTSKLVAGWLQQVVGGWPQMLVLLALFAAVALLTQLMSDAATTALIGPIAIALAQALGRAPEAFVVTVAMSAVTAFLTPIGHHGNLVVYGPGGYKFADFVKVGTPLTLVIALIVAALAPIVWPG